MNVTSGVEDAADDPVEMWLATCLERDPREQKAFFDALCEHHPEHARALTQRWLVLRELGFVEEPGIQPTTQFPESLGDFDLVRRLGGGGMGIVYLARQRSLERDVALKLIRPEHLYFPRARERFHREAEAVARLAHPGIVPIHMVGEEHDLPFFAMEFVPGISLADVLAQFAQRAPESMHGSDLAVALRAHDTRFEPRGELFERTWTDACVDIARQIADALAHAHERGVLHRDVKPSNVMLTPDGRVRLVDFGLTELAGVDGRTRTGSQLGTLHYMAPEQVRAKGEIDQRTDVYGLGVTLYELLGLQLPYRGEHAVEVQSRILDGSPDSLRARNRRTSSDVATVCSVAMDRDPTRRYASMADFRDDLERLLARQPIAARPPGSFVRILRWAQRHPSVSTALAALAILGVATPTALYLQALGHTRELGDALALESEARRDADAARSEAEAHSTAAEAARNEAMLEFARAEEAAATAMGSLDFVFDLFRRASPEFQVSDTTTALEVLEHGALRIGGELSSVPRARALISGELGHVFAELGRYGQARPLLESALETYEELDDPSLEGLHIRTQGYLGMTYTRLGELELAQPVLEAQLERAHARVAVDPDAYAFALNHLATLYFMLGRIDDAKAKTLEQVAFLESRPSGESVENLAMGLVVLAQLCAATRDLDAAGEHIERALALQREHLPFAHPELCDALGVLGFVRKQQKRLHEAREAYLEADCIARRAQLDSGIDYANVLHNWAMLELEVGAFDSASALLDRAARLDHEVTGGVGHVGRMCLFGHARVAIAAERWHDALRALEIAERAFESVDQVDARWIHAGILQRQGACHRRLGQHASAAKSYSRAVEVIALLRNDHPDLLHCLERLADAQVELADLAGALATVERALEIAQAAPALAKEAPRLAEALESLRARRAEIPEPTNQR